MTDTRYRYNVMEINSLLAFARIRGGFNNNCRNVYFVALQGADKTLKQDIADADKILSLAMEEHKLIYKRTSGLPKLLLQEDINYYLSCYNEWNNLDIHSLDIKISKNNQQLALRLSQALSETIRVYTENRKETNESIQKNFAVKMMYWADKLFEKELHNWTDKDCIKVIAENVCKNAESYFYYMLTMLGIDVLLLQVNKDMELPEGIKEKVKRVILGDYVSWELPAPNVSLEVPAQIKNKTNRKNITDIQGSIKNNKQIVQVISSTGRDKEKSFEELALLASSVVMITIYDKEGRIIGSGSGIMIGEGGYILTNYHVISEGVFFSVRIEEDDKIYPVNDIIKYNNVLDLAVTRIQRKLLPIPVYNGKDQLVRGQKIIAIGSPLGLFNSVSDGIISGFRTINNVNMIQFTAPVSPGSSGGAILNMYGEVIGISTLVTDIGQNINLAVSYNDINTFINGFSVKSNT